MAVGLLPAGAERIAEPLQRRLRSLIFHAEWLT